VIATLLVALIAALPDLPAEEGWAPWWRPVSELTLRAFADRDNLRPYSTPVLERGIAGDVGVTCERVEAIPCGRGAGVSAELATQAGLGRGATAGLRVLAVGGGGGYGPVLVVDRAFLDFTRGPISLEVGRNALPLGPGERTQLMVSTNAPPLDHLRAALAFPLGPARVDVLYAVARLRAPQAFVGTLLSIQRLQLALGPVTLGGTRLLQLGGQGRPLSLEEFVIEHFGREPGPDGKGISNNRVAFDAAVRFARVHAYYELALEDTRKEMLDAIQFDGDHLFGLDVDLRFGPLQSLLVEAQKTGRVSQEHWQYTTGMTNAGRAIGSPLGPDAASVYAGARFAGGVSPWVEWLRFATDQYIADDTGIRRVSEGVSEHHLRAGGSLRRPTPLGDAELSAWGERIGAFSFQVGDTRWGFGASLALTVAL
jgi:hypothetical protein